MPDRAACSWWPGRPVRGGRRWPTWLRSRHVELLPPAAQALVRATCRPRQQVVLGYWRLPLEMPAHELTAMIEQETTALLASGASYLQIAGAEPDPDYRQWLGGQLPAASVEVWPGTGHFPHLADPPRFARRLADTATWVIPAPGQDRGRCGREGA